MAKRTDNTMAKRRTDNTMAKRKRINKYTENKTSSYTNPTKNRG
jgi:hypothetical protein